MNDGSDNWVVVNRDTLRYKVGYGKYTLDQESEVNKLEAELIDYAVEDGKNLIIDATNLNPKAIAHWKDFSARTGYEIEFKEFYIPYAEAVKRSKQRRAEGGLYINKTVMLNFYRRYYPERLKEEFTDNRKITEYVEGLPDAVICDLDGTLALHTGRMPFDWTRCSEDVADPRMLRTLNQYMENGTYVFFITGRTDGLAREETLKWLASQKIGYAWELYTRKNNDKRPGHEYKKSVYEQQLKDKYNVVAVFEDDDKCVEMFRNEGLLTFQVANTNY